MRYNRSTGIRPVQAPAPVLRAAHVTVNNAARDAGIRFYKNWRVPAESVISRVFADGGSSESNETGWWTTSGGNSLDPCPIKVKAKKAWDSVSAVIPGMSDFAAGGPTP